MKTTEDPVVVTETFELTPAELWHVLTDPEKMRGWFFMEMEDFEPRVGFETKFTIEHDLKPYTHQWKITEVEPEKRITYDWTYEGVAGRGVVLFEIEPNDGGSKLTVTNSATEDFPEDDPAFHRGSAEQGWQFLIHESLKEFIETSADDDA